MRVVTFQVFDGVHSSAPVSGQINISLVSDQPIMLSCGVSMTTFEEGSTTPTQLTPSLVLVDLDVDHVISSATVTISNAQMGDSIRVDSVVAGSLSVVNSGESVSIRGDGSATQYEVHKVTALLVTYSTCSTYICACRVIFDNTKNKCA